MGDFGILFSDAKKGQGEGSTDEIWKILVNVILAGLFLE